MAVNQQLKDYVDQQAKVGVPNDVIKTALIEAGWQERDINEAMAGPLSSAVAGAVKPVETAKPADMAKPVEMAKPIEIKPIEAKSSDAASFLSKLSTGPAAQKKTFPVSFVTSDIFQPKNGPAFETKGIASQTSFSGNNPRVISVAGGTKNDFFKKPIVPIALAAVSAVLFAGAGILYAQNSGLQAKLNSVNEESASLKAKLDSLASDKNGLTDQITSLNQTVQDLSNQLSIFAMPVGTSTAELPVNVKGMLGGGGKSLYTITTSRAIAVYVKNSKDANVDTALKPSIGSQVEISGTHAAGSQYVTVTAVNGKPVQASLPPASTSIPNSSGTF